MVVISQVTNGAAGHDVRRWWLCAVRVSLAALVVLCACGIVIPQAHADDRQYEEFYTPPDPLPPGKPGDLIRTEPSRLVLEPSGQLGALSGPELGSCIAAPMPKASPSL